MVVAELGAWETSSPSTHVIEDGNVWFDTTLMDESGNVGGIAIAGIGGQTLRPDAKAFLRPVDHNSLRCHLSWADGRGGFDINNHSVCQIDEIIGAVSEDRQDQGYRTSDRPD